MSWTVELGLKRFSWCHKAKVSYKTKFCVSTKRGRKWDTHKCSDCKSPNLIRPISPLVTLHVSSVIQNLLLLCYLSPQHTECKCDVRNTKLFSSYIWLLNSKACEYNLSILYKGKNCATGYMLTGFFLAVSVFMSMCLVEGQVLESSFISYECLWQIFGSREIGTWFRILIST